MTPGLLAKSTRWRADRRPDPTPVHKKCRLEKKIERERLILSSLPELSLQILDAAKERGRVSISEIVTLTGANRNTVKRHLASLVDARHIVKHGDWQGDVVREGLKSPNDNRPALWRAPGWVTWPGFVGPAPR